MKTQKHFTPGYWTCQFFGWGLIGPMNILYSASFSGQTEESTHAELIRLGIWVATGLLLTHLMRAVIRRWKLLELPPKLQVLWILGLTPTFALLSCMVIGSIILLMLTFHTAELGNFDVWILNTRNFIGSLVIYLGWNATYFLFHNISKSRKHETEALRMKAIMKEMELKRLQSKMNPHFVFNALNGIRALVNEHPTKARDAIASLGNLLRTSLQAGDRDTVPLREELGIVMDYISLQKIRFEEQLEFEFDIDPVTLDLPVPSMMLQTLVENAVKHGIDSSRHQGPIRVSTCLENGHFVLVVGNPGVLGSSIPIKGFGLNSTRERLTLLYGKAANFEIRQSSKDAVEVRVAISIPPYPSESRRPMMDFGLNLA
jgi:two-component system LytT family sensor kinase